MRESCGIAVCVVFAVARSRRVLMSWRGRQFAYGEEEGEEKTLIAVTSAQLYITKETRQRRIFFTRPRRSSLSLCKLLAAFFNTLLGVLPFLQLVWGRLSLPHFYRRTLLLLDVAFFSAVCPD